VGHFAPPVVRQIGHFVFRLQSAGSRRRQTIDMRQVNIYTRSYRSSAKSITPLRPNGWARHSGARRTLRCPRGTFSMVDPDRLLAAYETARCDLMSETESSGHWVGQLSSSALSTATAISALALVERHDPTTSAGFFADESREAGLSQLIVKGLRWLCDHQNDDGGWGDTDKIASDVATTMLVRAAFQLTGVPADEADMLDRADAYIAAHGGVAGVRRRFGKDKSIAAATLA